MAKLTKNSVVIGPCNTFVVGELSPTGLTWQAIAEQRHERLLAYFKKHGCEFPTLEAMYCKGRGYHNKKKGDTYELSLAFFTPKRVQTPKKQSDKEVLHLTILSSESYVDID